MDEKLFNQTEDRIIIAIDFAGNKHQRSLKNFRFRASAYGILLEGEKVLLKRHPTIDKYDLPGGGIEMGETIAEGLVREFDEETGLEIKLKKLLLVEDSFFTSGDEDAHGILIFYLVERIGGEIQKKDNEVAEISFFDLQNFDMNAVHPSCQNVLEMVRDDIVMKNNHEQIIFKEFIKEVFNFVVGAIVVKNSKILIVRRLSSDFLGGYYELPGGGVEKGESLEEAVVRETLEETGLVVTKIKGIYDGFDYVAGKKKIRQFNFLVETASDEVVLCPDEHDVFAWVSLADLDNYSMTVEMRKLIVELFGKGVTKI